MTALHLPLLYLRIYSIIFPIINADAPNNIIITVVFLNHKFYYTPAVVRPGPEIRYVSVFGFFDKFHAAFEKKVTNFKRNLGRANQGGKEE